MKIFGWFRRWVEVRRQRVASQKEGERRDVDALLRLRIPAPPEPLKSPSLEAPLQFAFPDLRMDSGNVCRFIQRKENGRRGVECNWAQTPSRQEMVEAELYVRSGGVTVERCGERFGEMSCSRVVGHEGSHGHELEPGLILAPFPNLCRDSVASTERTSPGTGLANSSKATATSSQTQEGPE